MDKTDKIVAKYTKRIHPKDLGAETSQLETVLYSMASEIRDGAFNEANKVLKIAFNLK